ncbi:MAG: N-acetyltransferase [Rhodospirillales bacterium]|jgi:L-amino acid N-acyltransferase YncA|nr:N-acetyltransferase [Rhodospirillales bacterium]
MTKTMDIQIRDAQTNDMAEITEIYAHHVLHGLASFEEIPPTLDEMTARFNSIRSAGYPYIVAELEGSVAGYAYLGAYRARPAYRHSVENSVYIAPDMTGNGIGSALLAATIAACEGRNYNLMIAVIGDSENKASIALHTRHGFSMVGILKEVGFKHGRWVDTVLMQKSLPGPLTKK